MFERFTDRARRVVVLAQEESKLLGHTYIGTEHLLLGLLAEEEGVAAKAMTDMGMTLESAREKVEQVVGRGDGVANGQHVPFTADAKKVLEQALREALVLHHSYIGTEHLLLGLLKLDVKYLPRETEAVLFDIDADALRLRVFGRIRATDQAFSTGERRGSFEIQHDLDIALASVDVLKAELAEALAREAPED